MLFTLQLTLVSSELETVAVNVSVSPSNTVPVAGVTLMVMEGGGGDGCVTEPAPPPPQPRVHAPIVRRMPAGKIRRTAGATICTPKVLPIIFVTRVAERAA